MAASALLFHVGVKRLALLVQNVVRVLRAVEITPMIDRSTHMIGIINVEGEIVPVGDIQQLLGQPSREIRLEDFIIIGKMGENKVAFVVDFVEGTVKYSVEQFVAVNSAEKDFCIEGILNLNDELIMVCDLEGCFSAETNFLTSAKEELEI